MLDASIAQYGDLTGGGDAGPQQLPYQVASNGRTPAPPPGTQLPTGKQLTMVQTLIGEQTNEARVGTRQYADDQSGSHAGPPTGPVITDATLDKEASLMAGKMLNLGRIGDTEACTGLTRGITLSRLAENANPGSQRSTQLQRDINAVRNATRSPYFQWRAVDQGFIRSLGDGLRVAGTDFLP